MVNLNNFLTSTGFTISLRSDKYSGLDCSIQSVAHPAVNIGSGTYHTPYRDIPIPGDKYMFDPLTVTILMESNLQSYETIFNWIKECIETPDEPNFRDKTSDIILSIRDAKNRLTKRFTYVNAFPSDLGALNFSTTDSGDSYITVDATFQYSYFKLT